MNLLPTLGAASPVDHVTDKPWRVGPWLDGGEVPWFLSTDGNLWWISNVTIMLVLGAVVTCLLVIPAARRIRTGSSRTTDDFRAQGLLANLVETVCLYLRNQVFRNVLKEKTDTYTPILWTLFWFILICNLMGLIPLLDITAIPLVLFVDPHAHGIGGTATQSIWVTGALALIAAVFYMGTAILTDPLGFLKHLTGGAPIFMWPIMIPVEILGYLIKPFALAIRLFANMTGGHLVLAVLLSFVPALIEGLGVAGYPLAIIPLLGATGINLLEVLVACIQAYIFTFLTCLFLGQLVVHDHGDHDTAHEHTAVGAH